MLQASDGHEGHFVDSGVHQRRRACALERGDQSEQDARDKGGESSPDKVEGGSDGLTFSVDSDDVPSSL